MYSPEFEMAVEHAMLYEVGGHWNLDKPGVREGLIDTKEQRRAVGYVNIPQDRGGETKYGIAARANPDVDIADLDWEAAKRIYYKRYWLASDCDQLPPRLSLLHFDGAVNHGIGRANKFLQRAVGAAADGDIGPATLAAVRAADELKVCEKICHMREEFYRAIVDRDSSQSMFLNGWLRRINEVKEYVLNKHF